MLLVVPLGVLGAALLKAWRISDPTSTSFLAVGMVAVLALLFAVLAGLMIATRRIDWYGLFERMRAESGAAAAASVAAAASP